MEITYVVEGKKHTVKPSENFDNEHLGLTIEQKDGHLKIQVHPKQKLEIKSARYYFQREYSSEDRIFANGYQSWTDAWEHSIHDAIGGLKHLPRFLVDKYSLNSYGDYDFFKYSNKAGILPSYGYTYIRNGNKFTVLGSMNENDGYTIFKHNTKVNRITIIKDIEGLVIDGSHTLFDIMIKSGAEQVIGEYFQSLKAASRIEGRLLGYATGYRFGREISHQLILDNMDAIKAKELDVSLIQIDSGYETFVGDWNDIDYLKFPYGMAAMVEEIHQRGFKAGITIAPFIGETASDLFKSNPEWFKQDSKGIINSGLEWSGHHPLNLDLPEVREHLKSVIDYYLEIGFDVFKFDYLYAAGIGVTGQTRAQAMVAALEFLRSCIGDKMMIVNQVPLFPALSIADICQVSCNIGYDYDGTRLARRLQRERVSTKNAIGATIFRRHLNHIGWASYSDVVPLKANYNLSDEQIRTLMQVETIFNDVLFVSEDFTEDLNAELARFKSAFDGVYDNVKVIGTNQEILIKYENETQSRVLNIDVETGIAK